MNIQKLIEKDYLELIIQIISISVSLFITAILFIGEKSGIKSLTSIVFVSLIISLILQVIVSALKIFFKSHAVTFAEKIYIEEELKQYKNRLSKVSLEARQISAINYIVHFSIFLLGLFLKSCKNNDEDSNSFKEFLSTIIYRIFFTQIQEIFEQTENEYFSSAIYLYDSKTELLWDFGVGGKDKQISYKYSTGRVWFKDDNGHVCYCFRNKEEMCHEDLEKQIKSVRLGPWKPKDSDIMHYRSAITLPIFKDNGEIRGVFCITSNKPGCFSIAASDNKVKDEIVNIRMAKINAIRILNELITIAFNEFYGNENPPIPREEIEKNKDYIMDRNPTIIEKIN